TKTLQNAIEKNQLAQALLFCGPRGVGKTTCARILAHTINEFDESQELSQSMNVYELDAASNNSVDDIRNLIDQVRYPPQYGKYKVYIIDEVHMLSNQAFNAFLKTLEEPPSYAIFILATTEKHKVIPTILSRCQIYDFNRIGIEDMVDHLKFVAKKEKIKAEEEALHLIAQKADGALRDALSFFDMIVTFSADNKVTLEATLHNLHVLDYDYYFRVTDYLLQENTSDTLLTLEEILSKGFDSHNFINGLSEHLRNLLVCKDPNTVQLMEVSDSVKKRYLQQCQQTSKSFLLTALNICNQCDLSYKSSKTPRLHVEIALMKIAHVPSAVQLAAEQVKKKTFKSYSDEQVVNDKSQITKPNKVLSTRRQEPRANDKSQITNPNEAPSTKRQTPNAKRQAPSTSRPASTTKLPSLAALKSQVAEEEPVIDEVVESTTPRRSETFTQKELVQFWQEFADLKRKEGKQQEFLVLSQDPELVGELTVQIKLNSSVQIDTVDRLKSDLMPFLRDKLKNDGLKLEAELELDESKPLIYTPAEKFKYLSEKHPTLKVLQEKLGLDPDF
ncbi:MAG: DNA polymerase III subunit gamma/tau, partial [Cyclobacteriaceae bacterium]